MSTETEIKPASRPAPPAPADSQEHVSLCEAIDRLLHTGVVLRGEVRISVADVDLVYLGFQLLLASTETARTCLAPSVPAVIDHDSEHHP